MQELTGWGRQRSGSDHEYNSPASYLRGHWEHGLSSCLHGWQWIWTTKKSLSNQAFFFFLPKSWPLPSLHPQNALPWQRGVNSQTSFIPWHSAGWDLVSLPTSWPHVRQVIQRHTLLTVKRSSHLTIPSTVFSCSASPISFSFWYRQAQSKWRYPTPMANFTASLAVPWRDWNKKTSQ